MTQHLKRYWVRLTGDPVSYSMENRAFNLVSVITLVLLIYLFIFDVFIDQWVMCIVIATLFTLQSFLYYHSLIKRQYGRGIIVYALAGYAALIINYRYNSGIGGPTMFVFFLLFQLVLTISPARFNKLWLCLHIGIATSLWLVEYLYPSLVIDDYPSRSFRFFDFASTYAVSIAFIYFITTYLKGYYKKEKRFADQRLIAISDQNTVISKQNDELKRLNAEKDKLFSIISHDLRSPIDSIKGYLEILSRSMVTPVEKAAMEQEMLNQVRYTSELLQNMLYWSKGQMSGLTEKLAPVKLKEIVDEAGSYRLSGAANKNIKLTYSIDKEMEVIADADMLRIVLRNLLSNAVKFTPNGGEVVIKAVKNANNAQIAIKDTGIGISAEKQRSLFTLRSESTFGTNDEKGVGLGLLLCKEFIERQDGTIWLESTPGVGSTFFISLPLAKL